MLMQGYDFLELNRRYGCKLEMGGNDQWSNILAGADLIRRKEKKDAYGLTLTLLTMMPGQMVRKYGIGPVRCLLYPALLCLIIYIISLCIVQKKDIMYKE